MAERIRIDGSDFESSLDNGEFPESVMEKIEEALARMKESPGDSNEEILLVLVNDFEPEEDEEEDEESDEEPEKKDEA